MCDYVENLILSFCPFSKHFRSECPVRPGMKAHKHRKQNINTRSIVMVFRNGNIFWKIYIQTLFILLKIFLLSKKLSTIFLPWKTLNFCELTVCAWSFIFFLFSIIAGLCIALNPGFVGLLFQ